MGRLLNLLLTLAFGKQEKIERRTAPRSCHCWSNHTHMRGVQHSATCPMSVAYVREPKR